MSCVRSTTRVPALLVTAASVLIGCVEVDIDITGSATLVAGS
jgi:hypothetical protein